MEGKTTATKASPSKAMRGEASTSIPKFNQLVTNAKAVRDRIREITDQLNTFVDDHSMMDFSASREETLHSLVFVCDEIRENAGALDATAAAVKGTGLALELREQVREKMNEKRHSKPLGAVTYKFEASRKEDAESLVHHLGDEVVSHSIQENESDYKIRVTMSVRRSVTRDAILDEMRRVARDPLMRDTLKSASPIAKKPVAPVVHADQEAPVAAKAVAQRPKIVAFADQQPRAVHAMDTGDQAGADESDGEDDGEETEGAEDATDEEAE